MKVNFNDFKSERECIYKGDRYTVRDNGAVLRHSRKNKPLRKLDNQWTFGTPNNNGYMLIASEVVHRIVAYAFLGEPPTTQHIIDHIDTNRQNNRPQNLRWLTKLENVLNNPITAKKIIYRCGSIEAFLKDPSILRNYESEDPNFAWMRTVTPEEAQISWERLSNWAKRENDSFLANGGSLGEWIFNRTIPKKKTEEQRIIKEQNNDTRIKEIVEKVLQKIELDTGLSRDKFSSKSKKMEYLHARVYAAKQLRLEVDLSEETIGKIIGRSKSMVNSYLNYTESFLKNADFNKKKG
jgi:hypothetical protein